MSRTLDTNSLQPHKADSLVGAWIAAVVVAALVLGLLTLVGEPLPAVGVEPEAAVVLPVDPAAL